MIRVFIIIRKYLLLAGIIRYKTSFKCFLKFYADIIASNYYGDFQALITISSTLFLLHVRFTEVLK